MVDEGDWLPAVDEPAADGSLLQSLDPRTFAIRQWLGILALVGLALLPAGLTPVELAGVITMLYFMLFAMSWDFVSGYTGQISLGHTMFFATGGYATTVLNLQHGVHPFVSVPVAVGLAALLGLAVGVPALRLRGPYLSLVTLIVPLLMLQLAILFSKRLPIIAPDGLKGTGGFILSPAPFVGTQSRAIVTVESFQTAALADYYLSFLLVLVVLALLYAITRSDAGAVLTAIREDEDVVAAVGLSPAKFKIFAFVVSGAVGGLAGAAFVHSSAGHPLPQLLLELRMSLQVIVMAVLGGMGTIVGAMLGAAFVAVLNEGLGALPVTVPYLGGDLSTLEPIPVFLLGILVLLIMPEGLLPGLVSLGHRGLARVRGEHVESTDGPTPLESTIRKYRETLARDEE